MSKIKKSFSNASDISSGAGNGDHYLRGSGRR